jgi:signal transduction histidine kinase
MEAELIKAKEKAEESDRLKSAFLANMSHEIRTPLNSIIGFSELLNDEAFDDNQKSEFVSTIIENGNNLLSIISDIMDFSMLEAQQMKIREEKFQIRKLLDDIFIDFRKKAKEKSIELKMSMDDKLKDTFIISDLYRIKQVLINLTGNAIKFTSQGFVEIGCYKDNQFVVFHVKDSGIGIPAEYHHSIFERFRQVDLAKSRKYGGNGLGLSISKNLVELLGGKIWVESEPDKYSHFFFSIPFKKE